MSPQCPEDFSSALENTRNGKPIAFLTAIMPLKEREVEWGIARNNIHIH